MTTSLTYADIDLGYSPEDSPTDGKASQTQIGTWIADADARVEMDTDTTAETTMRDLLVKEAVKAMWRTYERDRGAAGGSSVSVQGGSVQYSPSPWAEYKAMLKSFKDRKKVSRGKLVAHDFGGVTW